MLHAQYGRPFVVLNHAQYEPYIGPHTDHRIHRRVLNEEEQKNRPKIAGAPT